MILLSYSSPELSHYTDEARINAEAVQLLRCSQFSAAETLLLHGLSRYPGGEQLRANLLRLYLNTGRIGLAMEMVRTLSPEPLTLQLAALCGQIALQCSHPELGYTFFSRSLKLAADNPSLLLPWAQCCIAIGRLSEAEAVLMNLCHRFPDAIEPALTLAICQSELGLFTEALACYTALQAGAPGHPLVLINKAKLHHHLGQDELAEATLRQLPDSQLDSLDNQLLLADVLFASGQKSKAQSIWRSLVTNNLAEFRAVVPLLYSALESGDHDVLVAGVRAATTAADAVAYPTRFWSVLADCPRAVQQDIGPADWFAPEQLVQQSQLFEDGDTSLLLLHDWVLNHPTLLANRASKPTQGGSQTHELLADANNMAADFKQLLLPSLKDYLQRHSTHPALSSLRSILDIRDAVLDSTVRWSGWGVVLNSGGWQRRHTHPESVISGVLYLAVPAAKGPDHPGEGCLAFSAYGMESALDNASPLVHPKPGLLVLFPSFMPHETIPTLSDEPRICIAFNVF